MALDDLELSSNAEAPDITMFSKGAATASVAAMALTLVLSRTIAMRTHSARNEIPMRDPIKAIEAPIYTCGDRQSWEMQSIFS